MSGLNLKTATGSDLRRLQDRLATLRDKETPTDRENRLRTERAQQAQQAAASEAQFQTNTAAFRAEDMERTKQRTRATKLIAKINKSTHNLTTALPEGRGGGGEVGKLGKHYNKAMKTAGRFITDYAESNPVTNKNWHTLSPNRQRALTHFHQILSSNAQHHIAINKFNTAKKHAEATADESEQLENLRSKMTQANQQNLDGWMNHLDIPVVAPLVSAPVVAQVISSSAKTDTGGRKTRKRKRKRRRKTRKRRKKKKTKRKRKKRHRHTKRR